MSPAPADVRRSNAAGRDAAGTRGWQLGRGRPQRGCGIKPNAIVWVLENQDESQTVENLGIGEGQD